MWSAVNVVLLFVIAFQIAEAQTLQPVTDGGINWWPIGVAAVALIAIFVVIVLAIKRKPNAQAEAIYAAHTELSRVADSAHNLMRDLVARMGQTTVENTFHVSGPPPTPGKSGQSGTFTIEVTGDPAKDIPAINAQYFG